MATQNRFPAAKRATTFNGRDIKIYNGTGASKTLMNLTGISIEMKFKSAISTTQFAFTTADNSVIITGLGAARMMPRVMNYPIAEYKADLILKFPNGTIKPYGELIWPVK